MLRSAWRLKFCATMSTPQRRTYRLPKIATTLVLISLLAIIVVILNGLSKIRVVYNRFDGDSSYLSINLKHKPTKRLGAEISWNKLSVKTKNPKPNKRTKYRQHDEENKTKYATERSWSKDVGTVFESKKKLPKKLKISSVGRLTVREFATRRKHMLKNCQKYNVVHPKHNKTDKYTLQLSTKVLYCPVAKVATRFLYSVFYNLGTYKSYNRTFTNVSPQIARQTLVRDYDYSVIRTFRKLATAIMFVRDPYSRLFSAYVDKYFSVGKIYLDYAQSVLMYARQNKTNTCGHDVSFQEFVRFVILTSSANMDRHYQPMTQTCEPCAVKFDVIGKLETLSDDTDNFLRIIGAKNVSGVIHTMDNESEAHFLQLNARNLLRDEKYILKCMTRWEMLTRFWRKKQITGVLNRTAVLSKGNYSNEEFIQTVLQAHEEGGPKKLRHRNRLEAMIEAYSTIPDDDLHKLKQIYKLDFSLFNYTDSPDFLIKSRNYKSDFSYFNLNI